MDLPHVSSELIYCDPISIKIEMTSENGNQSDTPREGKHPIDDDDSVTDDSNSENEKIPAFNFKAPSYSYNDSEEGLNIDLFISEVGKLPCIWNYKSPEYNNRVDKFKAWQKLCQIFFTNYNEMDNAEKGKCVLFLQRKWRSLRDSYNRDMHKAAEIEAAGGKKRRCYVYGKQLSFLKPLIDNGRVKRRKSKTEKKIKRRKKQVEIDSDNEPLKSNDDSNEFGASQENPISLRNIENCDADIDKVKDVFNNMDYDMHFLISLYNDFKSIPSNFKLDAKSEIIDVIRKYKKMSTKSRKIVHVKRSGDCETESD